MWTKDLTLEFSILFTVEFSSFFTYLEVPNNSFHFRLINYSSEPSVNILEGFSEIKKYNDIKRIRYPWDLMGRMST